MITIEDIARQAGVSTSTVSRALAGSTLVNAVTRQRIERIATDTGYKPNEIARSLATRSTRTLGLIVPEVHNPYYPKLIQLVADQCRQAGYTLQLHLSNADQQDEAACIQALSERRADGVLLATGSEGLVAHDEVSALVRRGVPVVLMGWVANPPDADIVMGDDASGAYDLTKHLIALGHRRMVMIADRMTRGPYDRIRGYEQALDEAGLHAEGCVQLHVRTETEVQACVRKLLDRAEPPTALLAYQDMLAAHILKSVFATGLSVPGDVAVVGFDNLDLAGYLNPGLTTVDYPVERLAELAVSLLLERLSGRLQDGRPRRHLFKPHLVVRQSCGAALLRAS